MNEFQNEFNQAERDANGIEEFKISINNILSNSEIVINSVEEKHVAYENTILSMIENSSKKVDSVEPLLFEYNFNDRTICAFNEDSLTSEQISYYQLRSKETTNASLKYRYANFLYDYAEKYKVVSKYETSKEAISAGQILFTNDHYDIYRKVQILQRIIQIATRMGNYEAELWAVKMIIQEMSSKSMDITTSLKWVSHIIASKGIVNVSQEQVTQISKIIDQEISDYSNKAWYTVLRNLYKAKIDFLKVLKPIDLSGEINQLISLIEKSFEDEIRAADREIVRAVIIQDQIAFFKKHGTHAQVGSAMIALKNAYKKANQNGEFKTIRFSIPLSDRECLEMQEFIDSLTKLNVHQMLKKIGSDQIFVPSMSDSLSAAVSISEDSLTNAFPVVRIHDNRRILSVETKEQHQQDEFKTIYGLTVLSIKDYLKKIFMEKNNSQELNATVLLNFFKDNNNIDSRNIPIIKEGIEDFFDKRYISALSVLAPQSESTFRRYFENIQYVTTSLESGNNQKEQTFNAFLEREDIQKKLGKNLYFFVKFVLVDKRGLNLRNEVGHGLINYEDMNEENCLLVIYLMILLATLS